MGLLELPAELLLLVSDHLDYSWDVNSFSLVNSSINVLLTPYLWQHSKQYSRSSTLLWGAEHGSEFVVKRLLDEGFPSTHDDEAAWEQAIARATTGGHEPVIRLLLEARTRSQPSDTWSTSLPKALARPLLDAAKKGRESIVRMFLELGVDWPRSARTGRRLDEHPFPSVTRRSVFHGHLSVIKLMIDKIGESEPDLPAYLTKLCFTTAWGGQANIIQYLLSLGVDPNAQDKNGKSLIWWAAENGTLGSVRCLLHHGVHTDQLLHSETTLGPLCMALGRERIPITQLLLQHVNVQNVVARGKEVGTLLCAAAACGSEALVRELLEIGCHPDALPADYGAPVYSDLGITALVWATRFEHEEIVRLLLKRGANPCPKAFSDALGQQNIPIVEMLLDSGADPNNPESGSNELPLYLAVSHEHLFRLLLEHGADPNIPVPGRLMILEALMSGGIPQVQMLLDRGLKLEIPDGFRPHAYGLLGSATVGGAHMIDFLFSHGFRIPASNRNESGFLSLAICGHDLPALQCLIDHGDRFSDTTTSILNLPFDMNSFEVAESMFNLLLSHGADINSRNKDGRTCIWRAIEMKDPKRLKLFLSRGVSPLSRDNQGDTHIALAAREEFTEGLTILLDSIRVPEVPQDELRTQISEAKSQAVSLEAWKIVRVLDRFECDHNFHLLPKLEAK
ncbi:ankyrin repeat domain-containing protein [Aspergillus lucknowensis]|uniref:Ankyrin repeat-containing domain protein n=1 Tax=Aspergillus lucknowensis TaxID=176173 RepID=A0ABR4M2U0_9EURO